METTAESRGPAASEGLVPGLYWGVRESFVRYVLANPDGDLTGDDGVETDGEGTFRFPLRAVTRSAGGWRIAFEGDLRFSAHGGMLAVRIAQPVVELGASGGVLTAEGADGRRAGVVTLASAEPVPVDGEWLVFPPLEAAMSAEAVAAFGDAYEAGTPFDPLRIALPLSAVPETAR